MTALSRVGDLCGLNWRDEKGWIYEGRWGKGCVLGRGKTPASEAHSSGGGSKAECREKGSVSPAKATLRHVPWSLRCPAMGSWAGPWSQPTPLWSWMGHVSNRNKRETTHKAFLPLWVLTVPEVSGGSALLHPQGSATGVKAPVPGTPLGNGQWLRGLQLALLPFLRDTMVLQLQSGLGEAGQEAGTWAHGPGRTWLQQVAGAAGEGPGRAVCKALPSVLPAYAPPVFSRHEIRRRGGAKAWGWVRGCKREKCWLWAARKRESVLHS